MRNEHFAYLKQAAKSNFAGVAFKVNKVRLANMIANVWNI
jgi:hypothetical protein